MFRDSLKVSQRYHTCLPKTQNQIQSELKKCVLELVLLFSIEI